MKKALIFASGLALITLNAMAMPSFLKPAKIKTEIKTQIAKAKINQDVKIADVNLMDGIGTAIKYRYSVEPSWVDQFYTRIDQYVLTTNANIGTLLKVDTAPLGFSMQHGTEITFARQFKSQLDSVLAIPYTPLQIPFDANSFKKLNTGDFVAFKTHMNLATSMGMAAPLTSILTANVGGYAVIQGEFMIHIFKMSEDKFRMKLIALRGNTKGVNAGINVPSVKPIKMILLKPVAGKINKLFDITPMSASISKNSSDVVMFDYVFDLKNERARQAYNNFVSRKAVFNDLVLANPFRDFESIDNHLVSDLTEINDLAVEESGKQAQVRAIDQVFVGNTQSLTEANNFRIKFNLIGVQSNLSYTHSKIQSTERDQSVSHYLYDSYQKTYNTSFLFGLYGTENTLSTNLLFKADEKDEPVMFSDLIFARDIKIKELSASKYKMLRDHVQRVVPASVFNKIQWPQIDFSKGDLPNAFFRNQIIFPRSALENAPVMSFEEILPLIKDLARALPRPTQPPQNLSPLESRSTSPDWTEDYEVDLQMIAISAYKIFNPAYTPKERYSAFVDLRNSEIWQGIAPRFFMEVLSEEALLTSVRYDLTLEAKGMEKGLRFSHGQGSQGQLYKNLTYIQGIISNRSFDLRLYTNEKGEFQAR